MDQITTGIQTTGTPHLGNILGAMRPAVAAATQSARPPIFIIADMHSMLSVRDADIRRDHVRAVTAAWMALDTDEGAHLYRQSSIEELGQIAMLLSGTAMMQPVMEGALKPEVFATVHPLLMSADLLMVDTTVVPVGPDSDTHLDIAQDIARRFNFIYGDVLQLPKPRIDDRPIIPGIDGRKMSKSLCNTIDALAEPDDIRHTVGLFRGPYRADGEGECCPPPAAVVEILTAMGHGDVIRASTTAAQARELLVEALIEDFRQERETFQRLMKTPAEMQERLRSGEMAVRDIAADTLDRMRHAMGMAF